MKLFKKVEPFFDGSREDIKNFQEAFFVAGVIKSVAPLGAKGRNSVTIEVQAGPEKKIGTNFTFVQPAGIGPTFKTGVVVSLPLYRRSDEVTGQVVYSGRTVVFDCCAL